MPRCAIALFTGALLFTLAAPPAFAQSAVQRQFPVNALRGAIAFGATPPAITLNGQPAQLAPGSRIRGMNNMLTQTGTLVGQQYVVDYTVEMNGLVYEVWLLTPAEAAVRPWPTSPAQAAAWHFDPLAQTWTRP